MSPETESNALPYSPARLASNGSQIVVADRGGALLFWSWPDRPGPMVQAHGDGGPLAVVGDDFASSGGWDPSVALWDGQTGARRYHLKLFDGRVTALAGQGNHLIVAGANREPVPAGRETNKDKVSLQPGQLMRITPEGQASQHSFSADGQINALAAGPDWIMATDSARPSLVYRLLEGGQQDSFELQEGPVTALVATGETLYFADLAGVWALNVDTLKSSLVASLDAESLRVLALEKVGRYLFGATSEGIVRWPGGNHFAGDGRQPVAMARHGESLLVLWGGGLLEQRNPGTAEVEVSKTVPR
ncbi:MAG: hypothetical protein PVH03_14595 [Chloroflexota bacterium]